MSTAFICGNIAEDSNNLLHSSEFAQVVRSIVLKNGIDRVFITKRNNFDLRIYVSLLTNTETKKVEIIELADTNKLNIVYYGRRDSGLRFKTICPFEHEVENKFLYRKLYDYAIENSDYMLTFIDFDDDISTYIAQEAEKRGVKVLNLADCFAKSIFGYMQKE